jgi:hypothetical protein
MIRLIVTELALFAAPWLMWWAIHGRKADIADAPHQRLMLLGIGLALFGLAPLVQAPDPGIEGHYVPAHVRDGVFVPDHFEKSPGP